MQTDTSANREPHAYTSAITAMAILLVPSLVCRADRGGWHVDTEPVTLTESGQKAIIGWDEQNQILCLATDVSSSRNTKVIEFLPLPSQPEVTLGNRESFNAVQRLLFRHHMMIQKPDSRMKKGQGKRASDGGEPFTVTFHQPLGAHDVTVVKVDKADEFADWIEQKAKDLTGAKASLPASIRKLIAKYVNEYRCPYFVFDVIEVGPDPASIEPLIYQFRTPFLFYPLEISSTLQGQTSIDLIVFSEAHVDPDPLINRDFRISSVASVDSNDMESVLPGLKDLLGQTAMVQAFKYTGDIRSLTGNICLGPRTANLKYTQGEYDRAKFMYFYSAEGALVFVGAILTFACLWPMHFAAKRQKPRWRIRLLAGFLLGMPLGLASILTVTWTLHRLFKSIVNPYYGITPPALVTCAMFVGFAIFCFQLGLRRRWYLWGFIYAALAIPAALITHPSGLERLLEFDLPWQWENMCLSFAAYLLVFLFLFLLARYLIWKFTESPWGWHFMRRHNLLPQ